MFKILGAEVELSESLLSVTVGIGCFFSPLLVSSPLPVGHGQGHGAILAVKLGAIFSVLVSLAFLDGAIIDLLTSFSRYLVLHFVP